MPLARSAWVRGPLLLLLYVFAVPDCPDNLVTALSQHIGFACQEPRDAHPCLRTVCLAQVCRPGCWRAAVLPTPPLPSPLLPSPLLTPALPRPLPRPSMDMIKKMIKLAREEAEAARGHVRKARRKALDAAAGLGGGADAARRREKEVG